MDPSIANDGTQSYRVLYDAKLAAPTGPAKRQPRVWMAPEAYRGMLELTGNLPLALRVSATSAGSEAAVFTYAVATADARVKAGRLRLCTRSVRLLGVSNGGT